MNKIFTASERIQLEEKWHLTPDSDNGVILTFAEFREREKQVKENGKTVKTGETEQYLFEDKTYHTRVSQALRLYVETSLNDSETFKEIIEKEEELFNIINKLDKEFKQF